MWLCLQVCDHHGLREVIFLTHPSCSTCSVTMRAGPELGIHLCFHSRQLLKTAIPIFTVDKTSPHGSILITPWNLLALGLALLLSWPYEPKTFGSVYTTFERPFQQTNKEHNNFYCFKIHKETDLSGRDTYFF